MLTSRLLGFRLEGELYLSDKQIPHLTHFAHPLLCPSSLYKHSILTLRLNGKEEKKKGQNTSYVADQQLYHLYLC